MDFLTAIAQLHADGPDGLSAREMEIIGLIALGHTNAEIADLLFLSVRTVESHRARIQMKVGSRTRAELVAYALDHRMTETPAVIDAVKSQAHLRPQSPSREREARRWARGSRRAEPEDVRLTRSEAICGCAISGDRVS